MTKRLNLPYCPNATFMGRRIGDMDVEEARGSLFALATHVEREHEIRMSETIEAQKRRNARLYADAHKTIPAFRASE